MSHPGFLSQWSLSSIKEYSKIRNDSCLRNDEIKSPYLRAQIMKFRHRILLLLLFVALSANCAWACGDTDADHVAKFHHEHEHDSATHAHQITQSHHSQCNDSAEDCDSNQSGEPCSDDEHGHCHCPACGTACHAPAAFAPENTAFFTPIVAARSTERQAFYFADHLPEFVYLPIWQPPKLVA